MGADGASPLQPDQHILPPEGGKVFGRHKNGQLIPLHLRVGEMNLPDRSGQMLTLLDFALVVNHAG